MNLLPPEFKSRMKTLLQEEYEAFLHCYEMPYYRGIRLNLLKCSWET